MLNTQKCTFVSVHKSDCEKLIAAYDSRPDKRQRFAAMFNNRNNPTYQKVREMVALNKELGELRRVNWIITTWFRWVRKIGPCFLSRS